MQSLITLEPLFNPHPSNHHTNQYLRNNQVHTLPRLDMPAYYSHDDYAQVQAAEGSPADYYYIQPFNTRQHSPYRSRPRSLSPPARRKRNHRDLADASPLRDQDGPLEKARDLVDNTFTNSSTGLRVGVLGAIVGGLIAREASEATTNRHRSRGHHGSDSSPLVSTLVGAAVGGLAANAVEKRIEVSRVKTAEMEEAWERKWGRDSRGRRLAREDDLENTGRRGPRRRSSSLLHDEYADSRAVCARPGRSSGD